jgi:dTDP-4-dehydrorhamnose reductase
VSRILILGASGFIGNTLYRELSPFHDVYGTYFTNSSYKNNRHFVQLQMETDEISPLLEQLQPAYIISALRGDFEAQVETHAHIAAWVTKKNATVIFLSSANVFDAFSNYPSYECDKTLSESVYGRLKIKLENQFMKLPEEKYLIARLPMVFGRHSPRIKELKDALQNRKPYEVFPDLVMNTTYADKLVQQLHYLINQRCGGIFHLGSKDLIHHNDFITELAEKLNLGIPIFKNIYTSNDDRYLAVLPRDNPMPEHLSVYNQQVIENSTLSYPSA